MDIVEGIVQELEDKVEGLNHSNQENKVNLKKMPKSYVWKFEDIKKKLWILGREDKSYVNGIDQIFSRINRKITWQN